MKWVKPEAQVQKLILDWLAAKRIFAIRINVGAMKVDNRFVRFGAPPGTADILAFPIAVPRCPQKRGDGCLTRAKSHEWLCTNCSIELLPVSLPTWIECKAPKGKQSELQKSFQAQVESHGHRYVLAKTLEDVKEAVGS